MGKNEEDIGPDEVVRMCLESKQHGSVTRMSSNLTSNRIRTDVL